MMKFILSFWILNSIACDTGMFPKDFMSIPMDASNKSSVTEAEFLSVIKNFESKIGTWVEETMDQEVVVFKSWSSNAVNAYAEKKPKQMLITVYGGIARHPAMTIDGFSLVLCHELGHHLGGYPKKSGNTWSSAEGQADYYSTTKCLRRLWQNDNNEEAIRNLNVPAYATLKCSEAYSNPNDAFLCARLSMAGMSLAKLFQALDHESFDPEFDKPDPTISRSMMLLHPFSQCRLDTYFQGALCTVDYTQEFDEFKETDGACSKSTGYIEGLRPACWFKAKL